MKRKKQTVAIIGAENEAHCAHMKAVLEERGAGVRIVDTFAFPDRVTFTLTEAGAFYQGKPLDDISSVYVRTVFYSHPPYDLPEVQEGKPIEADGWYSNYASERERQSLLSSWVRYLSLSGKKVVNPVQSFDLHYLKPYQLALLERNGIPVPKTVVTNDAAAVLRFRKSAGEVIYKPVAGGSECKRMEEGDWKPGRLKLLQNAPVIFQEYIDGYNIRAYVLGGRVISCGVIHTRSLDYRGQEERIERFILPKEIARLCVKAARLCGMYYTGIDLKLRSNGTFVFLECNPSAMFLGFQSRIGDPIDEQLADYLLKA